MIRIDDYRVEVVRTTKDVINDDDDDDDNECDCDLLTKFTVPLVTTVTDDRYQLSRLDWHQ